MPLGAGSSGAVPKLYLGERLQSLIPPGLPALRVENADGDRTITLSARPGEATVFNENGGDVDFRIEGDTVESLFLVDASEDTLSFGGDVFTANGTGIVIGHTAKLTVSEGDGDTDLVPEFQVLGTGQPDSTALLAKFNENNASAPMLALLKSGNAAIGSNTIVADDEYLGRIIAFGDDGVDYESPGAEIRFVVDGTPGVGVMPGSIEFWTTAAGGETLVNGWQINALQELNLIGDARINFSSATILAANTDGGVMKAGTSGAPVTEDTAGMKFISFYWENGATSGDSQGIYNRLFITGEGGGGESLRSFTSVTDVEANTVRGAHISLSFGSEGTVTGMGAALETTLHLNSGGTAGGTLTALKLAINSDGAASDPAGSQLSYLRIDNQGLALDDVDDDVYLFDIQGHTIGDGNLIEVADDETGYSHNIRIRVGGTDLYVMLADNRT